MLTLIKGTEVYKLAEKIEVKTALQHIEKDLPSDVINCGSYEIVAHTGSLKWLEPSENRANNLSAIVNRAIDSYDLTSAECVEVLRLIADHEIAVRQYQKKYKIYKRYQNMTQHVWELIKKGKYELPSFITKTIFRSNQRLQDILG